MFWMILIYLGLTQGVNAAVKLAGTGCVCLVESKEEWIPKSGKGDKSGFQNLQSSKRIPEFPKVIPNKSDCSKQNSTTTKEEILPKGLNRITTTQKCYSSISRAKFKEKVSASRKMKTLKKVRPQGK